MALDTAQSLTGNLILLQAEWLWLIPLLALTGLIWSRQGQLRKDNPLLRGGKAESLAVLHPLAKLIPSVNHDSATSRALQNSVIGMALILFCIAMAQPIRIGERIPDPPQSRDLNFIIDTTVSMNLRDYLIEDQRVDRMTLLKAVLDQFVQALPGDRISLTVFGDKPYIYLPSTQDQALIRQQLSRIQTGMAGRYKAVGDAIAFAVQQAKKDPRRHRVLILFTDMNSSVGNTTPAAAAELSAKASLPIYTVAIGSVNREARETRDSGLIYEPVNLPLLQQIAQHTGGKAYHASDYQSLKNAIGDIDQQSKNISTIEPRYFRQPLYHWLLLAALALITLYQAVNIFSERRAHG